MKLSDYLAQYLVDLGVKKIFLLTGGACAHIVDSIGRNPHLGYICVEHEQAAAMAADAYARVTKNIGVAVATSGPGATNMITGVCCSYFDSIPTLFISGQVNLWETKGNKKIRQLGFQETDIISIVKPITKFSVLVKDPLKIKYYLDKAVHIAKSDRSGPVWLDIPTNVQHAEIDPEKLVGFNPKKIKTNSVYSIKVNRIKEAIYRSKRPVIIAGAGLKRASSESELLTLLAKLKIPTVSSWSGIDVIPHDHPLYVGQIGVYGSRAANFAVQNSDLILSLGSRLDTRQTGGQPKTFARKAVRIVVDISWGELNKKWVKADVPIRANVKNFLIKLNSSIDKNDLPDFSEWHSRCLEWKEKYPILLPEYFKQKGSVNPYVFMDKLSKRLGTKSIITIDNGGISVWSIQGLKLKKGQEVITAFGHAPMGYALPAAIGAAFAKPNSKIICIIGDGGLQLTHQELQTIRNHNLPIKIFVINNNSYGIIKQFQEVYFKARYEATVNKTGYSAPSFIKLARGFDIKAERITCHSQLDRKLDKVLALNEPVICDVRLNESQKLIPKLIAIRTPEGRYISKPIEDMSPLLPRDEFRANMIIDPLPDEGDKDESDEAN